MSSVDPKFPFKQAVVDFVDKHSRNYIIYTDWYTGWLEVVLMTSGKAKTVCDTMRTLFKTYGASEELSLDGGPLFESPEYNSFLKNWSIRKHTSLAYYPKSNCHAELAVKTAKCILADDTDNCSHLCHDHVAWALLTHRNTPVQDLGMSLAIMLYGRIIKDHLQTQKQWKGIREVVMAKRHMWNKQFYKKHCCPLRELQIGDFVQIQN